MLAIMKSMSDAARRLLHAARFAAEKHAGQKRKGANEEPYVNHVIEVAALIANHLEAVDPDVLVGGVAERRRRHRRGALRGREAPRALTLTWKRID